MKRIATIAAAAVLVFSTAAFAGQAKPVPAAPAPSAPATLGIATPADYVIGFGDVLIISYWQEPTMSQDNAVVRPDGMITLPLLNDVSALGLKPEQLRERLAEISKGAGLVDPRVTVGVKQINSRKVFIEGGINKPGPYDLLTPLTVLQFITVAGGTKEFVSGKNITIIREENGKQRAIKFNLQEVREGKKLEQNIQLKPGDTVLVPE